jgi:hypothetical protein
MRHKQALIHFFVNISGFFFSKYVDKYKEQRCNTLTICELYVDVDFGHRWWLVVGQERFPCHGCKVTTTWSLVEKECYASESRKVRLGYVLMWTYVYLRKILSNLT